MADKLAWDFRFPAIGGGDVDLGAFRGQVLLVVNTASFCGFTGQYAGLKKLHATPGLTVIGVPGPDFHQESAENATVQAFCETRFRSGDPA